MQEIILRGPSFDLISQLCAMSTPIDIHSAQPSDVAAMLEIYRPHVEEMATSFEYDCLTIEEFTNRMSNHQKTHPWLVAYRDGVCLGYAYSVEIA